MKKIIFIIIVIGFTILNLLLFRGYYKKTENYNINKNLSVTSLAK